jgi:hypothetical protein
LGGTLRAGDANEHLGRFILSSNSIVNLEDGAAKLQFAASGNELWNSSALLIVTNWSGSLAGDGDDQLRFGAGLPELLPSS